jgi:hypothetical protein
MKTIKISNTLRSWTEEDMKEIHAILAAKDGEFIPVRDVSAEHLRCLSGMSAPKPYPDIKGAILDKCRGAMYRKEEITLTHYDVDALLDEVFALLQEERG